MPNQHTENWDSLRQKIEHYLDRSGDCWLWTRSCTARGYGNVAWKGRLYRVHRAYLIELGHDVPEGMDVDHLCRTPGCANPDHLEVVTHRENVQRGEVGTWDRGQFCKRGHEFTTDNTRTNSLGHRECRECHRMHNARKVPCEICGKEVSAGNRAAHRRAMHDGRY